MEKIAQYFQRILDLHGSHLFIKIVGVASVYSAVHDTLHRLLIKEPRNSESPTCLDINEVSRTSDKEIEYLHLESAAMAEELLQQKKIQGDLKARVESEEQFTSDLNVRLRGFENRLQMDELFSQKLNLKMEVFGAQLKIDELFRYKIGNMVNFHPDQFEDLQKTVMELQNGNKLQKDLQKTVLAGQGVKVTPSFLRRFSDGS